MRSIVCYDLEWSSKPIKDMGLDEMCYLFGIQYLKCCRFYPLSEVVDGYQNIFMVGRGFRGDSSHDIKTRDFFVIFPFLKEKQSQLSAMAARDMHTH